MDRKQVENYIFSLSFILPVLIFIVTPAHPSGSISYRLDGFINQYLFGNGWYSPSNYPFAAKVTNSFSAVLAMVTGLFMGIWRRNDIIGSFPKNTGWYFLVIFGLGIYMLLKSFYPQEFSAFRGRGSFIFTESFHNNPILFLAMMIVKTACIYLSFRLVSFVIYLFRGKK